ncbi:MAG TPA: hypothetical protein DCM08_00220, partial [Microscillaceae bacterium]|nr:hypothetical protein [Microscillaceae bacterium]
MHLKFYLFSFFIFLGIQGQLFAQNPKGSISGQVFDTKGEVLLFANVRLLNTIDSSLVSGAITNAEGFFQIEGIEKGVYWLSASQVGYQTTFTEAINLAAGQSLSGMLLVLPEDVQQLQSVEVVAKKQLIEQKPDKIVMNVENSIIGTGMNAAEVLKRAPGVTVDRDGSVGLKGRDQVLVLMDDKPLYLNAAQVGNLLKSLPANQIQSIEIITNPSAKYDAAGNAGIINIKLKKGAADGFNGSVNLNYGQGYYPKATGGFSLNYQKMGFRVTAHYDLAFRQNFDDATLERRFNPFNGLPQTTFLQRAGYRVPTFTHTFKTTLDYTWRDKNTLTLLGSGLLYEANWRGGNLTQVINDAGNLQELYLTTDQSQDYWRDWNGGMAYVRRLDDAGTAWSVEVDGKYYDQANRQNFVTQFVDLNLNATAPNFVLNGRIPTLVNQLTWKTDFTKVISPVHKIEAGLKGLYVSTDSDIRYLTETGTLDSTQSNFFSYKENIHAAYFSWRGQWQKWGLQVGLRAEHTRTQGLQRTINSSFSRDYLNLFPNVGLQYKASANHEWNLQYSRRIDRPDYQNLNPFQYFFDAFSIYAGNP